MVQLQLSRLEIDDNSMKSGKLEKTFIYQQLSVLSSVGLSIMLNER